MQDVGICWNKRSFYRLFEQLRYTQTMIRQYELIDKILRYNEDADIALINRAYVYSMKAHGNQKRASGEPYLVHPLEVANILVDLKLDEASIACGLLHDTLEDTLTSYEELKKIFGDDVADLTDGVTKLSRIELADKAVEQAENFCKLILAMSKDIRVLMVKLADRLHNMRTIEFKKPASQKRIARETMEIFAPLAGRIGLYGIRTELEDISFKALDPEEYARIEDRLAEWRARDDIIGKVIKELEKELANAGIQGDVNGREKAISSIHKKMAQKSLTFDQLTDIVAYRILVPNRRACYETLGLIHDIYKAIPGRFKDYISSPKPNGYQSLHTAVIGPFGNRMEIQIRTHEMHDIAEYGVAAHWHYKQAEGSHAPTSEATQYKWLQQLVDSLNETSDPEEFLENAKMDLYSENVFVFTPNGDLITLPRGATPLDFAYSIHSDVGNKCQSAKINGRIVPLRRPLENGDQVEIVTTKNQKPSPAWRNYVVTGRARSAINRFLSAQAREEQILLGREILEKALKRDELKISEKELIAGVSNLKQETLDDAFVALAQGRLFPRQVYEAAVPQEMKRREAEAVAERQQKASERAEEKRQEAKVKTKGKSDPVTINGLTPGMSIHIGKCCSPLPGEPIVGIVTTGRGVTIHSTECKNLEHLSDQPDRWLEVSWGEGANSDEHFVVRLRATLKHDPGALSSFTTAMFNAEANITDLQVENRGDTDIRHIRCDAEVKNTNHLTKMMSAIKQLNCVLDLERLKA